MLPENQSYGQDETAAFENVKTQELKKDRFNGVDDTDIFWDLGKIGFRKQIIYVTIALASYL